MKWTISQLHQLQSKGLKIDEGIDLSDLVRTHSDIRDISLVNVKGRADISSTKATFHLSISGSMVLPCSRTLVDVPYPFSIDTTETFLLKPSDYETEEDFYLPEGDVIDLIPIIKEIIVVEIPMQVFCDDVTNEEGAAPQAGKDWEVISEEDQNNKIDPRLAGLANFFENEES
ncbi:YceD family protein [Metabacillus halosaccharovorans]|uniref:YceD family protein n=1 Tax=Metabacillus halosaccharovorans TaxID=930124 RepID=UPI002041FC6E|nr:YceD family protein [Metabacillus halosaccharovorans]MCM3441214.1 YceD family protein [Metabacillus halosaccharovorans]